MNILMYLHQAFVPVAVSIGTAWSMDVQVGLLLLALSWAALVRMAGEFVQRALIYPWLFIYLFIYLFLISVH